MTDTNPTVTEAEALEALDRMKNAVTNTLVIPRHSYHRLHAFILSFTNVERERDELRARNANLYATQGEELARIGVAREAEQAELTFLHARVETLEGALTAFQKLVAGADRVHPHGEHYVIEKADMDQAVEAIRAARKALETGGC